jgi:nitrite reductase (NADH) small subunit
VKRIVSKRANVAVAPAPEGSVEPAGQHPGSYQRIASVSELEPYGQLSKWVGDHDILVFRQNGEIKALSNVCPHFGGPVGYHQMKDGVFTCLWHNYRFEAASGRCLTNQHLCLRSYKLKVEDGGIWVQLVENPGT